jgi:RND family efflux transporter MFP subunit
MRKLVWPLGISAFFLFVCLSCSEKIEPGTTPASGGAAVAARVMEARSTVEPLLYEAVGTVKAQLSATVSSKLMGVIQAFHVKEGDLVKAGDLLVQLDERQVDAQLKQAQAVLAEARQAESGAVSARDAADADAQRALLSYRRNQTLLEGEAITRETFETVETQHKQAQAALSRAQAMVAAAQFRVRQAQAAVKAAMVVSKDARLVAPFDGRVTAKLADAGALAVPGTPLLTLEREGGYRIDLAVPEAHIHAIRIGQPVDVRIPARDGQPIAGTIDVIVPSADQGSRTFLVQVRIADTQTLHSGMFARVPLTIGEQAAMRIPESAVMRQGQLSGVFIVDAQNTARFRLIRTGRPYGDLVEVISGIKDGTRLVAAPPVQLTNGSVVEPEK